MSSKNFEADAKLCLKSCVAVCVCVSVYVLHAIFCAKCGFPLKVLGYLNIYAVHRIHFLFLALRSSLTRLLFFSFLLFRFVHYY